MAELPGDLIFDGSWSVGVSETNSSERVGGGTQGVSTHMADRGGLTGGPRRGHCRRNFHVVRADATGKATADLVRSAQLSTGERTSPGDESPRPVIIWSFGLKDGQNALCTVGSPRRHKTSVGFAQRLWRRHNPPSETVRAPTPVFPHSARPPTAIKPCHAGGSLTSNACLWCDGAHGRAMGFGGPTATGGATLEAG
jgi:hypothetical protein